MHNLPSAHNPWALGPGPRYREGEGTLPVRQREH
jgi:hypothetical protein